MKLQDGLGLMQDARVAATRLHDLATARGSTLSPTTVFVMGGMTERYRMESERLAHEVPGLLHELGGSEWRKLTSSDGTPPARARCPIPLARPLTGTACVQAGADARPGAGSPAGYGS